MGLYAGADLHANNHQLGILDESGKRVFQRRLLNDPGLIVKTLEPFKKHLEGIVVESTFNWYWYVDLLMQEGYKVHLSNPTGNKQYSGKKYSDDRHDAYWLADLLRIGILMEGYIYPREERPLRDLLRKRGHLIKLRTSLILNLQNIMRRNSGVYRNARQIKSGSFGELKKYIGEGEELELAGRTSKETIDFLTMKIIEIERAVLQKARLKELYKLLMTVPGIGEILALTIMFETGPIARFSSVGNYASYCRKVSTIRTSNSKRKGKGNRKNGNKYLAWAYSEAAQFSLRSDRLCKAFYNRKMAKANFMVAHNALAHKLARASYYIMRDQVSFSHEKMFGNDGSGQ